MCNSFLDCVFCRSSDSDVFKKKALKAHNDYRALHGVPPLKLDKKLCKFAEEWATVSQIQGYTSLQLLISSKKMLH